MRKLELKLAHYDDGKGKYQSHEVSFGEYCEYTKKIVSPELSFSGYGETYDEALDDFKRQLCDIRDEISNFIELLDKNQLQPVKIDCVNKVVGEIEEGDK